MKAFALSALCMLFSLSKCGASEALAIAPEVEIAVDDSIDGIFNVIDTLKLYEGIYHTDVALKDNLSKVISEYDGFGSSTGGKMAADALETLTKNLDRYYAVNQTVNELAFLIKTNSANTLASLELISDASPNDKIMQNFLRVLDLLKRTVDGVVNEVHIVEVNLEYVFTNMSQLNIEFQLIAQKMTAESLKESNKLWQIHEDLRKNVYLGCLAGLASGPFAIFVLPACYATAAGVVEGKYTQELYQELEAVKSKFNMMSGLMQTLAIISTAVRASIAVRRENLGVFGVQLDSAKNFLENRVDETNIERIIRQKRIIVKKLERLENACDELLGVFRRGLEAREQQRRRLAYVISKL
mmetsp:Transcript_81/g.194  ORF Transcript_81/g.194 Transcript_81/m.194 type:complete len:356 (-) Transcript_81:48-1115(-)